MAFKVFNLQCNNGHPFEGWLTSEDDVETQTRRGDLECPLCGSHQITKMPTAPRLNLGAREPQKQELQKQEPQGREPQKHEALLPTSEQMHAAFLRIAREIAAKTEDVGERFAEEARRIHYAEIPERGIRGVTTREEARALEEEGIRVMPFPLGALLKEPLQ